MCANNNEFYCHKLDVSDIRNVKLHGNYICRLFVYSFLLLDLGYK